MSIPPYPLILAHRGASHAAPENTMHAFAQAVIDGADGIECDCRLTADGQVVIIHDATLDRTTNGHGLVSSHTWNQLKSLDATGADLLEPPAAHRIPLLEDLFQLPSSFVLNLELKETIPERRDLLIENVANAILDNGWESRTIVSSFDHHALRLFKNRYPHIRLGALWSARLVDPLAIMTSTGAQYAHVDGEFLMQDDIAFLHHQGIEVIAWNVPTLEDAITLQHAGIDGLIVDYPEWSTQLQPHVT